MAREGWVKDLSPRDRRALAARTRSVRIAGATRRTKGFLRDNGALIAVGTLAVVVLFFAKDLKAAVGGDYPRLTP